MTIYQSRLITGTICLTVAVMAGCGKSASKTTDKSESEQPGKTVSKTESENGGKTKPSPSVSVTMTDITPQGLKEAIASHKGKAVLVDYWAFWCRPCKKAFPHTLHLSKEYKEKGLVVMSVSLDDFEAREKNLGFLKEQGADIINYFSSDQVAPDTRFADFEIPNESIPCYKIYKKDGTLLKTISGGDKDAEIEAAVKEALGLN